MILTKSLITPKAQMSKTWYNNKLIITQCQGGAIYNLSKKQSNVIGEDLHQKIEIYPKIFHKLV